MLFTKDISLYYLRQYFIADFAAYKLHTNIKMKTLLYRRDYKSDDYLIVICDSRDINIPKPATIPSPPTPKGHVI